MATMRALAVLAAGAASAAARSRNLERDAIGHRGGSHLAGLPPAVPSWTPTYVMNLSTIAMPCNDSGFFTPSVAGTFGVIDYDWSNAKQLWANAQPMDCEELLVEQAAMTKAVNPDTRVFVYRNLVKALPWYTSVREKLADPAYSSWFLKFNTTKPHVPQCDDSYSPPLCSEFYHDQDQTPEHPHGDGSCTELCDCGGVPCGEYLWDHRSPSLRDFLVNEFVMGPTGLGNPNISGLYLDDGWANTSQAIQPWQPSEGFCDHSPIGGATEEDYYCTADMGLTQADTTAITDGWRQTMAAVQQAIVGAGKFAWAYFAETSTPPNNTATCANWFRTTGRTYAQQALMLQWTDGTSIPLKYVPQDLATFLLIRGDYAWLGWGWVGCITNYALPPEVNVDYGTPATPYYNETVPGASGVFVRSWTKADVQFDCNTWTGTITMKE